MTVREPAVAGMFYQGVAVGLKDQIESCFLGIGGPGNLPRVNPSGPRKVLGLVSPHAGYIYSGPVAAWAYSRLAQDGLPDVAVLIGPDHRSFFPPVALSDEDVWRTPMGDVELDISIAEKIAAQWHAVRFDSAAHRFEHSLEVQLPFLQYLAEIAHTRISIVPILVSASVRYDLPGGEAETVRRLGEAIADASQDRNVVIIASTDFTHYERSESAKEKDSRAISAILSLDEQELLRTVEQLDISMCGALPTAVAIAACKKLGATSAHQLAYRNSGDVTGDYKEVVGYAALDIMR